MADLIEITICDQKGDHSHLYSINRGISGSQLVNIVERKTSWKVGKMSFNGRSLPYEPTLLQSGVKHNDIIVAEVDRHPSPQ